MRRTKLADLTRKRRGDMRYTLADLAKRMKCSVGTLSRVENGILIPSSAFLKRLAKGLRVKEDDLFLAANRVPPDVTRWLLRSPASMVKLRRLMADDEMASIGIAS